MGISGISTGFPVLSQSSGQVAHVLLTRSPLGLPWCCHQLDLARLACVKHAASVRPEPGSNSPSRPQAGRKRPTVKSESRVVGRLNPWTRLAQSGCGVWIAPDALSVQCLKLCDRTRSPALAFTSCLCSVFKERWPGGHASETVVPSCLVEGCGQNSHFLGTRTFQRCLRPWDSSRARRPAQLLNVPPRLPLGNPSGPVRTPQTKRTRW